MWHSLCIFPILLISTHIQIFLSFCFSHRVVPEEDVAPLVLDENESGHHAQDQEDQNGDHHHQPGVHASHDVEQPGAARDSHYRKAQTIPANLWNKQMVMLNSVSISRIVAVCLRLDVCNKHGHTVRDFALIQLVSQEHIIHRRTSELASGWTEEQNILLTAKHINRTSYWAVMSTVSDVNYLISGFHEYQCIQIVYEAVSCWGPGIGLGQKTCTFWTNAF